MILYFDPVTKQIWCEGSDSEPDTHMDLGNDQSREEEPEGTIPAWQRRSDTVDFGDNEINAAAHLASTVSILCFLTL